MKNVTAPLKVKERDTDNKAGKEKQPRLTKPNSILKSNPYSLLSLIKTSQSIYLGESLISIFFF